MARILSALLCAVATVCATPAALATPIVFTFSSTATGTLTGSDGGATAIDPGTSIRVTLTTDTAQLEDPLDLPGPLAPFGNSIGYGELATVTATLTLNGVELGALSDVLYVYRTASYDVGFGHWDGTPSDVANDLFGVSAAALTGYDLQTAIGPVTGAAYFPGEDSIALASGGSVTLTGLADAVSFSATLQPTEVPEPATLGLALAAAGVAALAGRRRRPE